LRASTRPKFNLLLLLRNSVRALTFKVIHALISVECLLSTTLLSGSLDSDGTRRVDGKKVTVKFRMDKTGHHPKVRG
jgi:hypothetical protein